MLPVKGIKKTIQAGPTIICILNVAFNLNFGIFKSVGWFSYRALNLYDLKTWGAY